MKNNLYSIHRWIDLTVAAGQIRKLAYRQARILLWILGDGSFAQHRASMTLPQCDGLGDFR
ncbi:MAG: hypothetical protein QNJ22_02835 [Desulfosarcinaceae bacterium]|nr:hypothetical protein [Desulfosarcinaceae bacterium]